MKALTLAWPKKSTNVRIIPWQQRLATSLPLTLGRLSRVAPGLAAAVAERLYVTPPRLPVPAAEREFLAKAHRFLVRDGGRQLAAWSWGDGPTVVLIHGWGGRSGQFRAFVPELVAAGFSVVAFDAPGHGETGGRTSSILDFSRAIQAVVHAVGPVHAIIGHSVGGASTAIAMDRGMKVPRAIFLASPTNALEFLYEFSQRLGLSDAAVTAMRTNLERRFGFRWEDLRLDKVAAAMTSRLLVVHDRNDRQVPFTRGQALAAAWPGAQLVATEGLGHYRILRAEEVITRALTFLRD